jgi:hypothetical protein
MGEKESIDGIVRNWDLKVIGEYGGYAILDFQIERVGQPGNLVPVHFECDDSCVKANLLKRNQEVHMEGKWKEGVFKPRLIQSKSKPPAILFKKGLLKYYQ